jgi:sialic acid synthase SpsE
MIILDMGSGATTLNDKKIIRKMINALEKVDTGKHEIVIKFQLFKEAKPNIPLDHDIFEYAYGYGRDKGYQVTASVFDKESLEFLQDFDVPFIKIACREDLYPLVRKIDRAMVSYSSSAEMGRNSRVTPLCCIRAYPATVRAYERSFPKIWLNKGISDHTVGFKLWNKYHPDFYEKHYVLERDPLNPDAGMFAATPAELEAIL